MKVIYSSLLVLLFMLPAVCQAGPIDKVADLMKQGNVHELVKLFAANVDMAVLEETNVYSKAQAEIILEKFFKENKPAGAKIFHRVNSSATYNFAVLILTTNKGKFRVAYTLKEMAGEMVLIDLRIESEKT
ncbi:DUF4783 domain-containing protein [Mucilaginibacter sp.]|uniref:DUF4783 domain-containing protein n=1 Tax=Mucilaginibacter sp. TaxID=1882438 RepID=UPI0035BC8929